MRIFTNYTFKGRRSSIELPVKLVQLFNEKYPDQSIGPFISKLLKDETCSRVGSSLVVTRLVEALL